MQENGSGAITLCLAPLHGVTDHLFRQAFFAHFPGFDSAMAPFIASTHSDRIRRLHFRDLMPAVNAGIHLIPQILSSDAPGMVKTASLLAGMGYDEVNWNLGCPFPRVTGKGRGSGMLPHPERIRSILDETCPLLQTALSIKLRLGLSDSAEILRLVPLFNEYPLKRIFIHPRIGVQMYRGDVDLERFGEALALSRHEVIYNGDIKTCADLAVLRQRFPRVREWMIGRWAIRDPFLPGRIKGLADETDPVPRIRSFHEELYNRYCRALNGPHHVLNKMKEIWQYLGDALPQSRVELGKLAKSTTTGEYESWAERILG
jgi:tRNA-dihydrouridine synthase